MVRQPNVMLFECADGAVFRTQSRSATNFDEYVLTGPEFESIGPGIEDIMVHCEAVDRTNNFEYKVALQYKYERNGWTTVDLTNIISDTSYIIAGPFAQRGSFGVRTRLVLLCSVGSSGTGDVVEQGTLNITAAVRMYNGS